MKPTELAPRPKPFRSAARFVVAVEGEKEEKWYFEGLIEQGHVARPQRVWLEVLPADAMRHDSAPAHVVTRLADRAAALKLRNFDQCWLVVDRDDWPPSQLHAALQAAESGRWHSAISDPCFETWLQFHFVDHPSGNVLDTPKPKQRPKVAKAGWKRLRSNSTTSKWPFTTPMIREAIARAECRDTGRAWPGESPSSQVHHLVSELLGA